MKKVIASPLAPKAVGPYSQAIEHDSKTLYISGQLPIDGATGKMAEGIEAQTRRSLGRQSRTYPLGGRIRLRRHRKDHRAAGAYIGLRGHERRICRVFPRRQTRPHLLRSGGTAHGSAGGDRRRCRQVIPSSDNAAIIGADGWYIGTLRPPRFHAVAAPSGHRSSRIVETAIVQRPGPHRKPAATRHSPAAHTPAGAAAASPRYLPFQSL